MYSHVDPSDTSPLITTKDVLYQLRRIRKNRSPGVDGMSIEHLISIFLGGNRDEIFKREVLNDYVGFLNKWLKSDLTDSQRKSQYGAKPAGAEAVIHTFQQIRVQNPVFDIFSADAIKAFYNLNRDITLNAVNATTPIFRIAMPPFSIGIVAFSYHS